MLNSLAYLFGASATKKNVFVKIDTLNERTVANVIKRFFVITYGWTQ
jgi:hypothetical protein